MTEIRYQDRLNKLYQKDCRDMSELLDESVHMVCTSPPYWGLRKYSGVPDLVFDGEKDCQHEWVDATYKHRSSDGLQGLSKERYNETTYEALRRDKPINNAFCLKCNAWRGQLGQEPTPELFIRHIVDIFREVKRVLRSDGVCFINIGDSYWAGKGQSASKGADYQDGRHQRGESLNTAYQTLGGYGITLPKDGSHPIIKPQDKCLIPFRLAIALQEDGWWVRQDIIWQKNNPMPESISSPRWVKHRIKIKKGTKGAMGDPLETGITNRHFEKDLAQWQDCPGCEKCLPNDGLVLRHGSWRPTESHEYILMLTKSNDYYCDGEAVREKQLSFHNGDSVGGNKYIGSELQRGRAEFFTNPSGRNLRSVWTFSTQSYAGAHYATFPEKLPELCIKAGTSEYGVCAECGKAYARILKPSEEYEKNLGGKGFSDNYMEYGKGKDKNQNYPSATADYQTLGWRKPCKCKTDKPPVPSLVLDPFCGTGTTLYVASKLGRQAIGYELSEDYAKLTIERLKQQVMM